MNKELIEALKKELKHYEIYGKAERAEQVKKAIKLKTVALTAQNFPQFKALEKMEAKHATWT